MKVVYLLAITVLLAGCGEEFPLPSDEVAADIARIGVVPECARLRWAQQLDSRGGGMTGAAQYTVSAQYQVSGDCSERWYRDLLAAGFEPQSPHGEMIRYSQPFTMVALGGEGMAGVHYETDHLTDGLDVFEPEEAND